MGLLNKILIVDDDPLFRILTKEVLMEVGIADTIVEASNGAEGLNYLLENCRSEANCPQLILLDNKMPEVDGLEFSRRLCLIFQDCLSKYLCFLRAL